MAADAGERYFLTSIFSRLRCAASVNGPLTEISNTRSQSLRAAAISPWALRISPRSSNPSGSLGLSAKAVLMSCLARSSVPTLRQALARKIKASTLSGSFAMTTLRSSSDFQYFPSPA